MKFEMGHYYYLSIAYSIIYIGLILNWNIRGCLAGTEYVLVVISTNASGYVHHYGECDAKGARFGREMTTEDTLAGCTVAASPRDACDVISIAPSRNVSMECLGGYFAVAARGNCSFAKKAFKAEKSGYNGVIIYNTDDEAPVDMGSDGQFASDIHVPAFSVRRDCGLALIERFSYEKGYSFYIRAYWSYQDLLRYLVPFVAVVGVCFLVMFFAMIVKLVRDRRRRNRRRLSKKHLKQIPTKKFAAGDDPGTCPICLEDFAIGDCLRVLPCAHNYHSMCIDPWLLKNRRVCPICKRKVLPSNVGSRNSDSDTDEAVPGREDGPSAAPSTPERTPLLSIDERGTTVGNSTFYGLSDEAGYPTSTYQNTNSSTGSTPDHDSTSDNPTVDVDNRQSLLPQLSIHSPVDECTQPGFVTAASSFREGYANPNFILDAHEIETESGTAGIRTGSNSRNEIV